MSPSAAPSASSRSPSLRSASALTTGAGPTGLRGPRSNVVAQHGPRLELAMAAGSWPATAHSEPLARALPRGEDLLATAEPPRALPGGTTQGIDRASVQAVFRLNGLALPRDADQRRSWVAWRRVASPATSFLEPSASRTSRCPPAA